jgi:hypothetical protein
MDQRVTPALYAHLMMKHTTTSTNRQENCRRNVTELRSREELCRRSARWKLHRDAADLH